MCHGPVEHFRRTLVNLAAALQAARFFAKEIIRVYCLGEHHHKLPLPFFQELPQLLLVIALLHLRSGAHSLEHAVCAPLQLRLLIKIATVLLEGRTAFAPSSV